MAHKLSFFRLILLSSHALTCYGFTRTRRSALAILNAANEVAVHRFLNKEIDYISIPKIVEKSLEKQQIVQRLT